MANWYVNGSVGSSGAGTSEGTAFRTLAEAVAAMSGGDTVNVAGGVYRETLVTAGKSGLPGLAPIRILGNPADRFVISGAEVLDGLVRCTSADAADVGPNWPNVFKKSLPDNSFYSGDPRVANICEAGAQLPVCTDRADQSDEFFLTKPSYFHTAESVTTSGSNVTGFKKTSVTDKYTKTQLDRAEIYFVTTPNVSGSSKINFNTSTKTIELVSPDGYEDSAVANNFALFNILPAIRRGSWGHITSGSTVTVYVWPRDEANIAGGIEYSSRGACLEISGSSNIEIADFVAAQASSTSAAAFPIIAQNNGRNATNVHLHHFGVRDTLVVGFNRCAVELNGIDDLHVHDFSILRAQGGFGFFLSGNGAQDAEWPRIGFSGGTAVLDGATITGQSSGASVSVQYQNGTGDSYFAYDPDDLTGAFQIGENLRYNGSTVGVHTSAGSRNMPGDVSLVRQALRAHIHDFDISYVSNSPMRFYTQKDLAVYRGRLGPASKQSHGNTFNFYQICYNCLVWGVDAKEADGYVTWQEANDIVLAFCDLGASGAESGGNRAIYSQQSRQAELPGALHGYNGSYILNTRGVPLPERALDSGNGNGLKASSSNDLLDLFTVWNNIHHGSSAEDGAALAAWGHNINTKGSGTGSGKRGPNDVVVPVDELYTDPANGDFSYPSDSAVRTFAAKDWSTLIPSLKTRFPQVPDEVFMRDLAGDPIDWSDPPIGPTSDPDASYRSAAEPVVPPPPPVPEPPVRPVVRSRLLRLSVRAA